MWTREKNGKLKLLQDSKSLQDDERLNKDEKEFLSVLEYHVVWVGRYPIPTTRQGFRDDLDAIEDFELAHSSELEDFHTLFQSACGKLARLAARIEVENFT